jgi:GNAT superfamily N-acetyltransferase
MVSIRFVDKFPEPAFGELQREVFASLEASSTEFTTAVQAERPGGISRDPALWPPMFRFGAFSDEQLVGWTYGWFQRPDRFVMANSGVLPTHRRLGIYSRLVEAIAEYAYSHGASTIHSWHSVLNTPIIIAKLNLGFTIAGTHFSDHLGLQVELVRHASKARADVFRDRVVPFVWPHGA